MYRIEMENPYKGASPNSIVLSKNTFHWSQISTLSHSFTSPQNNIKCFTMLLSWQLICDNCGTYRSSQIECCTQFFSAKLVPVQLINELEGHELDLTLACHKSLGVCSRACSDHEIKMLHSHIDSFSGCPPDKVEFK